MQWPVPVLSLRAKLVAFACITLAPVAWVAFLTAQNYVSATRAQILSSSAATANVAVASIDDFVSSAERLLLILASSNAVQSDNPAAIQELFVQTLRLSPEYLSLYMLDASGRVARRVPDEALDPDELRYGQQAQREGRTVVSGRLGSPARLTAVLAVPIRRNQLVDGALGVEFAMERLQRTVADAVMREHAVVLLLDSNARVLVAPESRLYAEGIDWMSVPTVQAVLRGEQGAAEYRNPADGRVWLGAYAPVPRAGWAVLVSYLSDVMFAPAQAAAQTAALSLAGVLLLAVLMAFWLAARFTQPLEQVKVAALSIAQGHYDQRVPQAIRPHDEIGQLAVAFNQMAQALHEQMVALQSARQEIEQKAGELQQLLNRSVRVQEDERKRIAQDIHDGITQMLVGAIYEMQAARQALTGSAAGDLAPEKIASALSLVSNTVSEIRRVIFDLHPTVLDELGLVPALKRLIETNYPHPQPLSLQGRGERLTAEDNGNRPSASLAVNDALACSLQVEGTPQRLSAAQELALYRIAQEALNNVRQHAQARQARITLQFDHDATTLMVSDDGHGIARQEFRDADQLGLVGMRERAQSVGGCFELTSEPALGTRIVVTVPRQPVTAVAPSHPEPVEGPRPEPAPDPSRGLSKDVEGRNGGGGGDSL